MRISSSFFFKFDWYSAFKAFIMRSILSFAAVNSSLIWTSRCKCRNRPTLHLHVWSHINIYIHCHQEDNGPFPGSQLCTPRNIVKRIFHYHLRQTFSYTMHFHWQEDVIAFLPLYKIVPRQKSLFEVWSAKHDGNNEAIGLSTQFKVHKTDTNCQEIIWLKYTTACYSKAIQVCMLCGCQNALFVPWSRMHTEQV